ncbi:hypothetical protein MKX01_023539 [Papaver californicum]|nr:hypothetical protein MKX01_023539 [Papaver californicum]
MSVMEFSSSAAAIILEQEEDDYVGFEEGSVWLPTHILEEAWEFKYDQFDNSKPGTSTIFYQRPIIVPGGNRVSPPATTAGTGMRAVFLDSGGKKCGTGFFLPRRAGQNFQPNKKPACSPVLLPARVVQALNLNVHELGSQFVPGRDQISNLTSQGKITNQDYKANNKNRSIDYDFHAKRCVAASKGGHNSSADIFLPKEWSY